MSLPDVRAVTFVIGALLFPMGAFPQSNPTESPDSTKSPSDSAASRKRVELNLLGKEDAAAGEGRRNENRQFNLIDNNALKELNVRLGVTATIIDVFEPGRGYFGAEFGMPPSSILHLAPFAVPKWHGTIFANHQNSIFTARSFFQAGDVQPAHENRYGFSIGASPWRKAYFTLQGSQDKIRGSVNGNVLVPAADERTPLTSDPRLLPLIEKFLAGFPELPNRTDINSHSLNTNAPQTVDGSDAAIRLEQDFATRDRVMATYGFVEQVVNAFQFVAGQNPDTHTRSHRARLTWTRQWTPLITTQLSAGFDRLGSLLVPDKTSPGPTLSVSGLTTLGPSAVIPIDRAINLFHYDGGLTLVHGHHTLAAGMGIIRRQDNGTETDAHRGYFAFSNDFGKTAIENFLYGTPSQYIVSIGNVHRGFRQWLPQMYVGDDWKVSPDFTLLIGLRYEPAGRPYEVNHLNTIPYGCDCNNLAPRFGFAWRLPQRWGVLRSAYGLHYGDIFPVTYSQVRFSPPGSVKMVVQAPDLQDPLGGFKSTGQIPDARGNLYLLDPKLATPYSHQYNFSWEPDLSRHVRLQLGYVGSRSDKLLIMWYLNRGQPVTGVPQTTATINQRRPDPSLADVRYVLNGSRGYFDAARATLILPLWRGFTMEGAYWFSKAIDLGSDYTNTAYDADSRLSRSQSQFETVKDRKELSQFDQPNSFLVRASYELPHVPWQGWAGHLMNNWTVSGVALFKNGTPFTVTTLDGPGFGNVDGNGGDRPNLLDPSILGRTIGNPDTSVALLPVSAFGFIQPTDRAGSLGADTFRRGGIRNLNAALVKSFTIRSDAHLMLRAESINLTNTPQFAEPNSVLGTPEFGYITNTLNTGRTFRFGITVGW